MYQCVVVRRLRRQGAYKLGFEDWLFYVGLPFAAYVLLVVSPFAAPSHEREAAFAVGAAIVLMLFAGIHNSWDSISYHVFVTRNRPPSASEGSRD